MHLEYQRIKRKKNDCSFRYVNGVFLLLFYEPTSVVAGKVATFFTSSFKRKREREAKMTSLVDLSVRRGRTLACSNFVTHTHTRKRNGNQFCESSDSKNRITTL